MKRVRATALVAGLAAAAMVLTACGGGSSTAGGSNTSGSSTAGASGGIAVGLAYDIGGRGDKSFNDSAAKGLDKAKSELGVTVQESEAQPNETDADKEERLRTLADGGAKAVVAVGFAYSGPLAKVAKDYPDVKFAIVDDAAATGDNITNIVFAENESSFLVGAAAALKTKSGTVGFIGGVQTPLIEKFQAGYAAGAQAAKPGTKVLVQYLTQAPDFTGFNDPAKGETAAGGLLDQGADVVYQAAGGSGSGVFKAVAAKPGSLAIGVDSDQYVSADPSVQGIILTSALKNVDVGVFDFIKAVGDGSVKPGSTLYDLKNDGVGYATSGSLIGDISPQLDGYKAKIVDGSIKVPTAP
ncbi:BMP family ABC transporter substrate-binding protein [Rhodococcus antarcticus]|uniref:BMP family ABC transporter substrate-binding protein n=1 Tax=Rhodococcus antarcticus TaxID=2987751 RepID=A0ABY6P192_9NOCA|nr:BMP family ABC transporter substrate-binding protein [Rhodococcus antarcticus]UZJ25424.1 BMP family ABC transporter substrate-binding protein [Rhodococcus antarcticus]